VIGITLPSGEDGSAALLLVSLTPGANVNYTGAGWTVKWLTTIYNPLGTPKSPQTAVVRSYSGIGVIRSINLKEGWFEIDHEEIAGFMPAMRMQWSVKERSMLKTDRVCDKVDFTVEDNHGNEVVTALRQR
jgi:Cu/Ag efflux protein CusF